MVWCLKDHQQKIFHHMMDEIHRVVKGGGLVVIRVPHFSSLQTEWHNVYCGFRFLQGFCGVDDGLYFVNNGRGEYFVELYRALKFDYAVFDFLFNQYRFSYER